MTNEELVELIQSGDREKLPELWNQVERFVAQQAGKRARALEGYGGVTAEDLYQSGFLALAVAVDSYDPAAGRPFISWLALALRTVFAEAAGYRTSRRDPLQSAVSLDVPLTNSDGDSYTLADTIADPGAASDMESVEDELWREQLHAALDEALSKLPEGELEIILAQYYRGRSLSDLGPGARLAHDRAMRKLRSPAVAASLREFIEELTPYYAHVGSETFQRTGESAVEIAVFRRERMAEQGRSFF